MADTVAVPGAGKMPKKYVIGGVSVAGVFVLWRYKKAADAKKASTSVLPVDPITGLPYDPSSGTELTPGGNTSDAYSVPGGTYYQGGTSYSGPVIPQNNLQWTQNAVAFLTSVGFDGQSATIALGAYLNRATLSASQTAMVQAAVAAVGPPPYGGPYSTVPTPGVAPTAPTNLVVTERAPHAISLMWNAPATPGVIKYHIAERSPIGASDQDTTATQYKKGGLVANVSHTFTVVAVGANNQQSPPATVTATTLREGQAPIHTPAPAG